MTGKEVSEKIVLNEETKSRIIENGYRIAMQRKKNMKKRYGMVSLLLIVGIMMLYLEGNLGVERDYPIRVYAQEISEANKIDLKEQEVFTLKKKQTPLGLGYELYMAVDEGYYCKTISDATDDGLETIFSGDDYIYWIPDYWKNENFRVYDEEGNLLENQSGATYCTATVTYRVYDEQDILRFQMTVKLKEMDGSGTGEIIKMMCYPKEIGGAGDQTSAYVVPSGIYVVGLVIFSVILIILIYGVYWVRKK